MEGYHAALLRKQAEGNLVSKSLRIELGSGLGPLDQNHYRTTLFRRRWVSNLYVLLHNVNLVSRQSNLCCNSGA
jgi:hypothetical protein